MIARKVVTMSTTRRRCRCDIQVRVAQPDSEIRSSPAMKYLEPEFKAFFAASFGERSG